MTTLECTSQCKIKGHETTEPVLELTPQMRHYGRFNCGICGKFVMWAKMPKTQAAMKERQGWLLDILEDHCDLSRKEIAKICELYGVSNMNYKSESIQSYLRATYCGEKVSAPPLV